MLCWYSHCLLYFDKAELMRVYNRYLKEWMGGVAQSINKTKISAQSNNSNNYAN